jgi:23S rRNA (uracil1939-C5)-methyltransferase
VKAVFATELDDTGRGVGVSEGIRTHVTDLVPGETAEVAIEHASPHKAEAWARVVRRVGDASADRAAPACPAFGRCGGCAWQHVTYDAQLREKRARVERALGRPVSPVRASPAEHGYRNKGKYVVCAAAGGGLLFGAYAPRTHEVVDTTGCRVVTPAVDEVAMRVRDAAERAGLVAYSEATHAGELRYVVVREASDGGVLVALVTTTTADEAKLERVAAALGPDAKPPVRGVVWVAHDRRDGVIAPVGASERVLRGDAHVTETFAGVAVDAGAGEFVQVNRAQAAAIYARVAELARPARRAVDLFSGLGGIALHLARDGAEVVAVEVDPVAVAALDRAARAAGLPIRALAADAGRVDRGELGDVDVAVVNPPRKGLGERGRAVVGELAAPVVIYVSCGPEALGADLAALAAYGYAPDVIEPFDLMPGTAQVEVVVRLRR